MLAATFHSHGPPDVLRIEEVPRPAPAPDEVLVEVRAAGMNHLDLWVRRGIPIETTMPHIGGADVAGVVAEVGRGVEGWEGGERVVVNPALSCGHCEFCIRGEVSLCPDFRILGEHTDGGFAEYVAVPASALHRLPDRYPFEKAAALPVSCQTAWRAVVSRAALRAGEDILVLGASGGTAIACIQVAKLAGARVFAVTSGAENVSRVRALGADFVYDRLEVDFSRELLRDTGGRGVDVVVENVGQATWKQSLHSLVNGGRLVSYGATTGPRGELNLAALFWKQIQVIGTTMASRAEFEAMLAVALRGDLDPVIDAVLPLADARAAHERLESGAQFGKIVLVPGVETPAHGPHASSGRGSVR
jgi:NADPH:quinone reductase-like Zn-dependent oxidoreductase